MANRLLELQHFTAGLSGTMQWEVISNAGATLRALATGSVTEPRAGVYQVSVLDTWAGVIHWYDGTRYASERFDAVSGGGSGDPKIYNVDINEIRAS